ncbi:MAG: tryptophan--tRNA ligase [Candidatus Anstonellales archaeon]
MHITPWEVKGKVDYEKLIKKFGTSKITEKEIEKIKKLVGNVHFMISRGHFFSHRDLDKALSSYENGKGFFIYTGRGPSGKMHIGHLIPFIISKWFQDMFDVNVYIEITDDEKFLFKREIALDDIEKQAYEDILDIAALGFKPHKTFIFRDTEYIGKAYKPLLKIAKKITFSTARAVFGFTNETNIGAIFYPAYQILPTFFERKQCLIPCAIDQDPYWRIQRDIAESFGFYKTAVLHSKFLPPLLGMEGKMSSSEEESAIYLSDDEQTVRKKIMKYAFSGGQPTVEEHKKKGGNPEVDVSFQYLKIIFEPDDKKINEIEIAYRKGELLTGELKEYAVKRINEFLNKHQKARQEVKKHLDLYLYNGMLAKQCWEKKIHL